MSAGAKLLACVGALVTALAGVPAIAGADVEVRETSYGRSMPCPSIQALGPTSASGGCVVDASRATFDLRVATALGELDFGTCEISYSTRIGPDGRTLTDRFIVRGASPCTDAAACFRGEDGAVEYAHRWKGRIVAVAGGGFEHHVDACLDTCLGRFRGPLVMKLTKVGRTWRATPATGAVGRSGWRFSGGAVWEWAPTVDPLFGGGSSRTGIAIEPV